jgi:hypothetical protein
MNKASEHHQQRRTKERKHLIKMGWIEVFGCSTTALGSFRIALGSLLVIELVLRFRFLHPFYSDQGTLPLPLLLNKVDDLYQIVCFHCHWGALWQQQILLGVQVLLAVAFTVGYRTRIVTILSWYLYFSLTLRNTWLNYILDRYFHYLLFLSMFLPLDKAWSIDRRRQRAHQEKNAPAFQHEYVLSPATVAMKALVTWIYLDAGYGKWADPLGGWSYSADPLPALDTYARHTVPAQYLYALLGPIGLRIMTPAVVYVELFAAPVALWANYFNSKVGLFVALGLIWSLHLGIALTLRNAALLSFVACTPWFTFLPLSSSSSISSSKISYSGIGSSILSFILICGMVVGSIWLSRSCDQNAAVTHIWSTLLHNRWNVFVGAEEYVTWEIAPGQLQNGSIVDVWGRRDTVTWDLPGAGAPCTATARPGRWRSFPYLAGLEGEDGDRLWRYLCDEWDREHHVPENPGQQLMKYNFFMLQADVLPEMRFSATRKRLIKAYNCVQEGDEITAVGHDAPINEDLKEEL